jgi:hypothetical protein
MKRLVATAVVGILVVGFAFWWFSPSQVLKRRTLSLLETLTLEPGTAVATRQMGGYSLNALLAPEVTLSTPSIGQANGTFERGELESAHAWLCQHVRQSRFDLERFGSVAVSGETAEVVLFLNALVELPSYRPVDGFYQATLRWRLEDGGWRIVQAVWHEAEAR